MIPVAHQRATPSLSGSDHPLIGPGQKVPFVLVTSLFFLWGIPNNLNDVLIGQFMKSFTLSRFEAGLVQSACLLLCRRHGFERQDRQLGARMGEPGRDEARRLVAGFAQSRRYRQRGRLLGEGWKQAGRRKVGHLGEWKEAVLAE